MSEEIRRRCAEGSTSRENEGYKAGGCHVVGFGELLLELARLGLLALRERGFDYTLAEKAVMGTEE